MAGIGVALLTIGAVLLWSAITDVSPVTIARASIGLDDER